MTRPPPLYLALTLSALALAACDENTTPTQPETGGDPAPTAPSFALASNTWTAKAPRPVALFGAAAGVVTNSAGRSIVYVFGGTDGEGGSGFGTSVYHVATNTWTGRGEDSRVFVFNSNGVGKIGSRLYFSGGYDYSGGETAIRPFLWAYDRAYDPTANRLISRRDMPKGTADGVTGVIDGKLYVLPGTCNTDFIGPGYCDQAAIRKLYRFDPATNTWAQMAWCPHFHASGAGGVINGKFYVAGGTGGAWLDVYDPVTNSWKTLAPVPIGGFSTIGAVLKNKLFVITRRTLDPKAYMHAYDPVTNTWKTKTAPTLGHDAVVQVLLNGKPHLLAVGGFHSTNQGISISNDSELYTP